LNPAANRYGDIKGISCEKLGIPEICGTQFLSDTQDLVEKAHSFPLPITPGQ